MPANSSVLAKAANEARGLALDAVVACSSGHLGLPLGCAEVGACIFGDKLQYNPNVPKWLNRDRFVLSAGHGSMFLYGWLHLSGYGVSLDDVKAFRTLGSKTPGHPEFNETPGVEGTTGPLGQGIANAVGYAVSQKMAAAKYNTAAHKIFDNRIVVLCGDGCMQEGVAMEAISFAGHQHLDNLILIYDSNDVTLDAMAKDTQSEDAFKRMEATGWEVRQVDGHDMDAFSTAYDGAHSSTTTKPQLIIIKTEIGKGIPEVAGTQKAHGEGGVKFAAAARKNLGLPEEKFYVSAETRAYFSEHTKNLTKKFDQWQEVFAQWKAANPDKAAELKASTDGVMPDLLSKIPEFPADTKIATRKAGSEVLQSVAAAVPNLITGSADLFGSTLNYIASSTDFTPATATGRNIKYGIREHGMCAMMNGICYDGIFRPSGATFLVFADYCRASIRIAAMSGLPTLYIFTHDSVCVGMDGPTHQPVETVSGLRLIPNLDVIRPADPEETAGAFAAALLRNSGPTLLSLTRQNVPNLNQRSAQDRRAGVLKGAYVFVKETAPLECIILSCGSELQIAIEAAKQLGPSTRVVSVPSFFRFDQQPQAYKEEVLPLSCRKRIAVEAGVHGLWYKYVGLDGKFVCIDRFGLSAAEPQVLEALGMNVKAVLDAHASF
eukprot:NODE_228_length_2163_cov_86.266793_g152_i0.p1 GENE.NODE_228_length_2163_cov_86.266793_g152_i0~~NODE_228_length_2163_cov_86.266793_g152_i0.p1  ORF type:complete len:680 (-),score=223.72 NODE_228_length_2163_cov_86.266793_g152_i0:124-2106(-)